MRVSNQAVLTLSLVLSACGGTSTGATGGSGGAQAGASTGGSAAGGASGGNAGAGGGGYCPASAPQNGSACAARPSSAQLGFVAADCSWGDDPRPACRTAGVCQNGTWVISMPAAACSTAPKPAACPATPAAAGTACMDPMLQCWYEDGTVCSCSPCDGGSAYPICRTIDPPAWACVTPAQGCPNPAPQAGSDCMDATLQCGTSCELPIRCDNGAWQYGQEQCPICASPDTPIATPLGERPIAELRAGDLVYSVDQGAIVPVPLLRVGSTPVSHHHVLRVTFDDGRSIEVSAGHPLADGQPLSSLTVGAAVDAQHRVRSVVEIPYAYSRTYDILPGSSSGSYFASGALLGSTLRMP